MKLLYNDKIKTIETHMSVDIPSWKKKSMNVRNHKWVLNGVIQGELNRKEADPIDCRYKTTF